MRDWVDGDGSTIERPLIQDFIVLVVVLVVLVVTTRYGWYDWVLSSGYGW